MKKINGHPYDLELSVFKGKAQDTVSLAEEMCKNFHGKRIMLDEFQREYLELAIMAGCMDSHKKGFSNGIQGAVLNEQTVHDFFRQYTTQDISPEDMQKVIGWVKKYTVWLMEPKLEDK